MGDNSPLTERKLFCGGLNNQTTEAVLRAYLAQFGALVEVVVIKDRITQTPRGYGFATFATKADTQKVLTKTVHNVGGKDITLKLADAPGHKSTDTAKKIFIGGVNDTHTEDAVRNLFGQFGKIISVTLLKDQAGRSRGFGFLAFETSEAASAAMAKGTLQLGTAQITIKGATPRKPQFGRQFGRQPYQSYQRSYNSYNAAYGVAAAMRAQQMQRQRQYGAYSQYGATVATASNLDTVSNRHTVSKVTELLVMDARQAMDNSSSSSSSSSSRMGVMVPAPGKRVQGTVKRPTHAIRLIESHVQRFDDKRTCETKI